MALVEPNPSNQVVPNFPTYPMDYVLSDAGSECSDSCPIDLDTTQTCSSSDSGLSMTMDDSFNSSEGEVKFQATMDTSEASFSNGTTKNSRSTKGSVGSRKRKLAAPCRSSPLDDPNFRGVTIRMENKLINSEWKLVMQSTFSLPPKKKRKARAYVDSSDEEEISNYAPLHEGERNSVEKHCASCSVKKTPLWRDAEDGTPLCNACGIRYKKYKLRCGTCWHIPKKDEFHPICQYCGSFYEYVSPRR